MRETVRGRVISMDDGLAGLTGGKQETAPYLLPHFTPKPLTSCGRSRSPATLLTSICHAMGQFRHALMRNYAIYPRSNDCLSKQYFGNSGLLFVTIACLVGWFYPEGGRGM